MKVIDRMLCAGAIIAACLAIATEVLGQDVGRVDIVAESIDGCEPCRRMKADLKAGALPEFRVVIEVHRPPLDQSYPTLRWKVRRADGGVANHSFVGWPETGAEAAVRGAVRRSMATKIVERVRMTYAPPVVYTYAPPRPVYEYVWPTAPVFAAPPIQTYVSPPVQFYRAPRRPVRYAAPGGCPGGVCPPRRSSFGLGVGFHLGATTPRRWNVNGDWTPSRSKLINHLAVTHGHSFAELRGMSTGELLAMHDADHNARGW